MNKSPQKPRSLRSLSGELIYIIPFSLITAHLFVGFRRQENYLELFLKPRYWRGFLVSACIAFLLILYVKYVSRYFYLKPGVSKRGKIFLQFSFGFLLAIVLEFTCSVAYFAYAGYHISDTVYFDSYLLPIMMYILMINLWYADGIQHLESKVPQILSPVVEKLTAIILSDEEKSLLNIAQFAQSLRIVYISISDGEHYAKNIDGQPEYWYHNFIESIARLPSQDYFQVTRYLIIHRDIVCITDPQPKKKKLTIYLKTPFNEKVAIVPSSIAKFNIWLKGDEK